MPILAFDVGGSSVKYCVMDEEGQIFEPGSFPLPKDIDGFYDGLVRVKMAMSPKYSLKGAAFSMPGAVNNETGIIGGFSAVPYIHDFPIKKALSSRLGLPVAMENDANCAALGEVWLGAAKDNQDVAFVIIGTGVGGAIVKNRQIHHGHNLHGGEFGYMIVDSDIVNLSETGSTAAMANWLADAKGMEHGSIDGKKAFEMLEAGDEDAKASLELMYKYLAIGIFNVQYVYDPEKILIGGGISEREDFIDNINRNIDLIQKKIPYAKIRPDIVRCEYGNSANLVGAVYNFLYGKSAAKD